jgi:anti-sigma factor RsiW
VSQEHLHLTTEQLSAFIDDQLSAAEQGLVNEHLKQCAQCQLWLEELRQTVRLVHALPQPQLPRSFALSADVLVTPLPVQSEPVSHVATIRRATVSRVRTAIRVMSTLAAVIGLAFLLSGIIPASHEASSFSASTSSGSAASATNGTVANRQSQQVETPPFMATSIIQATPHVVSPQPVNMPMQPSKSPQNAPAHTAPSSVFLFDLSQTAGRLALGAILFILGCAGFIYLRFQHN